MNQKSLDKKKPKDVSKCCNCNVNVSNGKEGTNYYICDKCKQPCDVISKKKVKELDRTTEISIGELNRNKLVDEITSKELSKPKELDWELTQEQKSWLLDVLNTNSDNALKVILINGLISKLLTKQRTELLEEIKDLQTYVLFNDTEKLISLEEVINIINKK